MPRCKNESCKRKFIQKFFNQKTCSTGCQEEYEQQFEQKSLNQVSEKRQDQEKIYKSIRKIYLENNPNCEVCGEEASEIHHKNGRNGDRLNDITFFMAICRGCHNYVHEHPKESRELGYLI